MILNGGGYFRKEEGGRWIRLTPDDAASLAAVMPDGVAAVESWFDTHDDHDRAVMPWTFSPTAETAVIPAAQLPGRLRAIALEAAKPGSEDGPMGKWEPVRLRERPDAGAVARLPGGGYAVAVAGYTREGTREYSGGLYARWVRVPPE